MILKKIAAHGALFLSLDASAHPAALEVAKNLGFVGCDAAVWWGFGGTHVRDATFSGQLVDEKSPIAIQIVGTSPAVNIGTMGLGPNVDEGERVYVVTISKHEGSCLASRVVSHHERASCVKTMVERRKYFNGEIQVISSKQVRLKTKSSSFIFTTSDNTCQVSQIEHGVLPIR